MSKALIWFLFIIGVLFLAIGFAFEAAFLVILGLLMIGGGVYLAFRPGGILRKEQVVDNWSVLIADGQGKAENIFEDTKEFIEKSRAPALQMERRKKWLRHGSGV